MFIRRILAFLAAASLAAAAGAQSLINPDLVVTTYATGFNAPTQIRFLGPGDLLVTEKNTGRVQRRHNGVTSTVLDLNVANDSERGLLGIALDPSFATSHFVYLYYSATSGGADGGAWAENRLSRFTWNGTALVGETVLRTLSSAADGLANGPNHDGGPILFGPDGKLYGVTGDLNRNGAEQNNQAQAASSARVGGIYRLNADGTNAAGNPFAASPVAEFRKWYAYGVRNSYGIAFDPLTGNLWDTENGPESYDEINLVAPGFNSGWNQIMGPDARDPQGLGNLVSLPGSAYSDPEFSFLNVVGPTGLAFLANSNLNRLYRDSLLVGDINFGNLYLFHLNQSRSGLFLVGDLGDLVADSAAERGAVLFGQGFGGVTDIQVGPDGGVYVTSFGSGTIYRLAPSDERSWLSRTLSVGPDNRARTLWINPDGRMAVWSADANDSLTGIPYGPYEGWRALDIAVGTDNRPRVLWEHNDGRMSLWSIEADGSWTGTPYGPYPGWAPISLAVGPNNRARVQWNHTDGRMGLWNVAADGSWTGTDYGPFPGWGAIDIAVGADNLVRVLWNDLGGRMALWSVAADGSWTGTAYGPYAGWIARKVAVGSDNKARVLWNHQDRRMGLWIVAADGSWTGTEYGPYPGWRAIDIAVGADNKTRVLWSDTGGRMALWIIEADGSWTGIPYGPF